MSVLVTGYDQAEVHIGVSCRRVGASAYAPHWPFGRFTFGAIGCSLSTAGLPTRSEPRTIAWGEVVSAERTRKGVRLELTGRDPVEVNTLRSAARPRLIDAVRTYIRAGSFDDTVPEPPRWQRAAALLPARWF